jgi:hypothetical protein
MQARHLTRRFVLLLPLAIAACGGDDEDLVFQPLRYNDLPPIQVKVASIAIEQRFIPAGVPPDVSNLDPAPPADALKAMASDRLQAFGTANKAVFAVLNASLTRIGDVVTGSFAVSLTILDDNGTQLGFAEAHVRSRHTGEIRDIRPVLYDMTNSMMHDMNIEFEYQIRHNLKPWLTDTAAPATPVEAAPLDASGAPAAAAPAPGDTTSPPSYPQPPSEMPTSPPGYRLQPPPNTPVSPPHRLQPPPPPALPNNPPYQPTYLQPPEPQ